MSSAFENSGVGLKGTIQGSFLVRVPKARLWLIPRADAAGSAQVSERRTSDARAGEPRLEGGMGTTAVPSVTEGLETQLQHPNDLCKSKRRI